MQLYYRVEQFESIYAINFGQGKVSILCHYTIFGHMALLGCDLFFTQLNDEGIFSHSLLIVSLTSSPPSRNASLYNAPGFVTLRFVSNR